ncbi:styrene monooxygenase/indole monooxygenase family protein [Kitasatospora sp. NPDC017646]|uniref:styrene monooxygenase/indole monooxygenase family protein n=1 Tax=Kitasatospora sp. NPDC017646 TaxID=3364024 RepID=UPI0037A26222
MTGIGIIGSGISGLQLALRLQQLDVPVTLYSEQTAEELGAGRPRNFPARFAPTQQREAALGVRGWEFDDARVYGWAVTVRGEHGALEFPAALDPPASVVDFRLYLPHLLGEFTRRGGDVRTGPVAVDRAARRHDLVVVANGDRSVRELFPVDPARSPYPGPQRILCTGLYQGIREDSPHTLDIHFVPGAGEILRIPFLSRLGPAHVLAFEAVPGGPLEAPAHLDADADPIGFRREVLRLLGEFAPGLRERVDPGRFGLIAPGELAQGGVTPVVRQGWARLPDGTCALAVGDAWITNDPLTAQGANLGSHTAFALAALIAGADGPLDEAFCRTASARLWEHARHVVEWSNAFLAPPPPHVRELFGRAAADKRIADAFVSRFHDPEAMWGVLADPEGVESFLAACTDGRP